MSKAPSLPGTLVAVAALLVSSLLVPVRAATEKIDAPTEIRATYQVSRNGIPLGSATEVFTRVNDRYKISSITRTEGAIALLYKDELTMVSEGKIERGRLKPDTFSSRRTRAPQRDFVSTFDWKRNRIERRNGETTESFALAPNAQDRLSVLYQFVLAPPQGNMVDIWMSTGKEATLYAYRRFADATLTTALGPLAVSHYQRDAKEGESKAQLWLAKERSSIPAKVLFEDPDGTQVVQTLTALSVR